MPPYGAAALGIEETSVVRQPASSVRLLFDQAHGQQPPPPPLAAVAKKLGLDLQTSTTPLTAKELQGVRLLYLRAPSGTFTPAEAEAVVAFVKGGGSLLLVLDEERRQSLEKTAVNAAAGSWCSVRAWRRCSWATRTA